MYIFVVHTVDSHTVYMVSVLASSYENEGTLAEGKVYLSQYYYVCLAETLSVK
jgi:hypothetical protein